MEVLVRVTVSNSVYQFYQGAAAHVSGSSPEAIMSDTLTNYATMLDPKLAPEKEPEKP